MILRDAIFSSERRHLGAQPAAPAPAAAPEATLMGGEVREPFANYDARGADVAPQARQNEMTPQARQNEAPPLSSDHVASWLVTQDGATRTALAAVLTDELAAVRAAARTEGYEHGHGEAMKAARDTVASALEALAELHAAAESAFDTELTQLRDTCADVVGEVFFKLAGSQLATREAIVGCVAEVLKRVREERELRIHVNPADLPVLRTAEAGIAASLPGRRYTLIGDGRVETGGCIVESALGSLDGRLEVQLAGLCATLRASKHPEQVV